jgi:putative ABC transport system permease protein
VRGLIVLGGAVAAAILALVFFGSVNARRREFALLRMLGAPRRQIITLVLREAVVLGLVGGSVGSGLGEGIIAGSGAAWREKWQLPWAEISASQLLLIFAATLVATLLVSVITATYTAWRTSQAEVFFAWQEGEK